MIAPISMNRGIVARITGRSFFQVFAAQAAVSLVTTLVLWSLGPGWSMLFGLAFANAIGWLAWFVLPPVGRYAVRLRPVSRWALLTVAMAAVSLAGELFALLVLAAADVIAWTGYWSAFVHNARFTVALSLVLGIGITVYETMRYRKDYETVQARLSSLESRLQPHFLFNTLNSILALIPEDPAAAERMTERLAALLRFSLDSSGRRTVKLDHELKIATDYLEIERARFGARLQYFVDVREELKRAEVPPFSIQTLVENSVKHGGDEIRVSASGSAGRLVVEVWDSGDKFAPAADLPPGHGLENLRWRLAALWGAKASLEFPVRGAGTTVRITLPVSWTYDEEAASDCISCR